MDMDSEVGLAGDCGVNGLFCFCEGSGFLSGDLPGKPTDADIVIGKVGTGKSPFWELEVERGSKGFSKDDDFVAEELEVGLAMLLWDRGLDEIEELCEKVNGGVFGGCCCGTLWEEPGLKSDIELGELPGRPVGRDIPAIEITPESPI